MFLLRCGVSLFFRFGEYPPFSDVVRCHVSTIGSVFRRARTASFKEFRSGCDGFSCRWNRSGWWCWCWCWCGFSAGASLLRPTCPHLPHTYCLFDIVYPFFGNGSMGGSFCLSVLFVGCFDNFDSFCPTGVGVRNAGLFARFMSHFGFHLLRHFVAHFWFGCLCLRCLRCFAVFTCLRCYMFAVAGKLVKVRSVRQSIFMPIVLVWCVLAYCAAGGLLHFHHCF